MTFAGRTIAELDALPLTELAEVLRPTAELTDPGAAWLSSESGETTEVAVRIARDLRRAHRGARSTSAWATSASAARTTTLSPGEVQRLRIATQLRSGLFGVVYVLDEPSAGLHPADAEPLLEVLDRLKASGNSLFVVEHDMDVVRRADWVVDVGPGAGEDGGRVLYSGPVAGLEPIDGVGDQRGTCSVGAEPLGPPAARNPAAGCTCAAITPAQPPRLSTSTSRSAC